MVRQRGLSLVELLIGVAVGLFIVAVATTLLVGRVREHRASLIEGRLMQDLRAAADLVSRDLRRAGHWGDATAAVWHPGTAGVIANPYVALSPADAASDAVAFSFSRDATENHSVDGNEQFGFRLSKGVIQMRLGGGNWQALTDSDTLAVTAFTIAPQVQEIALQDFCALPCPGASTTCPPKQQVRSLAIAISGRSAGDASVQRSVRTQVRLRNDVVAGACPA